MRRINKIKKYLKGISSSQKCVIYMCFKNVGMFDSLGLGLLPDFLSIPSGINKYFENNYLGEEVIDRTQKETYSYWVHFDAPNFGDIQKGTHTIDCLITKQRYARTRTAPQLIRMTYKTNDDGSVTLYTEEFEADEKNTRLIYAINLFQSIQRYGWQVGVSGLGFDNVPFSDLNFEILPPGIWPTSKLRIHKSKTTSAPYIRHTEEIIKAHHPDCAAVGKNRFLGYYAYIFQKEGFVILENQHYGNASYIILLDGWEKTASLTKYEVYSGPNLLSRIPHDRRWESQIDDLFRK